MYMILNACATCHDQHKLQACVFGGNYICCFVDVWLTGTIGGRSLRVGTTLPTKQDFRTCMLSCSRICCVVSRRTWRSRCRLRWSRYCESRCQTSRRSTTSEFCTDLVLMYEWSEMRVVCLKSVWFGRCVAGTSSNWETEKIWSSETHWNWNKSFFD